MSLLLPDLGNLSIGCYASPTKRTLAWEAWMKACTDGNGIGSRPDVKAWKKTRAKDKQTFYNLIDRSENDRFSMGQYNTPYTGQDIDIIMQNRSWSIEHTLPRSFVNGRSPGEAEDDWLGWDVADRRANSTRSNLPLVLWKTPDLKVGKVDINGEIHFNPIDDFKARLARRWLFLRATYSEIDDIDPYPVTEGSRQAECTIGVRCCQQNL
jgi:hypothetical protein